jgi:glutamate carboxypeptidase
MLSISEIALRARDRLEPRVAEMVDLLGGLVRIESPSDDRPGLDRMADHLEGLFGGFGPIVRHRTGPGGASHLVLTVAGAEPEPEPADRGGDTTGTPVVPQPPGPVPHVAILCHYDTVWARGTLDRLPFTVDDHGLARGPGCVDMKGGIALLHFALDQLRELGVPPRRPVQVLFSCDEEVRSRTARPLIDALATDAVAALVLEAPLPGGVLKTARKGVGIYRLVVEGRAAHAGIEPDKGASAVVELAHQVQAIHGLNDRERGTSVNVGVIRGGTRPNVVAAHAEAEIDVRMATADEARRVDDALRSREPVVPGTRLTVVPDLGRPPMERTPGTAQLFEQARRIAASMGVPELGEAATGGASDGNLIAARGVPTLDGLGPHGGGAHADDEHVVVASMPHRAALIAGLLAEV